MTRSMRWCWGRISARKWRRCSSRTWRNPTPSCWSSGGAARWGSGSRKRLRVCGPIGCDVQPCEHWPRPYRTGRGGCFEGDRRCAMSGGVSGAVAIFLFVAAGFVFYLVRLNRRAKREQSEVDPAKLRKWGDDWCGEACAGLRRAVLSHRAFTMRLAHLAVMPHLALRFFLIAAQQRFDVVQLLSEGRPELRVELADLFQKRRDDLHVDVVGEQRASEVIEGGLELILGRGIFIDVVVAHLGELLDLIGAQLEAFGHLQKMIGRIVGPEILYTVPRHVRMAATLHVHARVAAHVGIGRGRDAEG